MVISHDARTIRPDRVISTTQFPVGIALALRQMALVQDELPKYPLLPEVNALLHYVPDLHRKMLLATLWNTGARFNEALALTRSDFSLPPPYPFVQLVTLKQRTESAVRTVGYAPVGNQARIWDITDRTVRLRLSKAVEAAASQYR